MKQARILGRVPNTHDLVVQEAEGTKHRYKQGRAIPEESAIHGDIMGWYPSANEPKFLFNYDGDELPTLLKIRNGGSDTGYHEFHYAGLYVESEKGAGLADPVGSR
jgi:hypothetical protein